MTNEPRRFHVLFAIPPILLAVAACDGRPVCPYDQTALRVNSHPPQWACVARGSSYGGGSSSPSPSPSTTSAASAADTDAAQGPPPAAAVQPASTGGATTPAPTSSTQPSPPATCDTIEPATDDVAVVDKSDPAPSLGNSLPADADGSYDLVQATFFRSAMTDSSVRSFRARLLVRGRTLTIGAQDTTVPGNPKESLSFLLENGSLTKTCDGPGGDISGWFFPVPVGQPMKVAVSYDRDMGFVRLIVSRSDGATELVFSK